MTLGPRWYSWMLDNRLHAIVISAYLWGWLRFLPEATVIRVVRCLRPLDRVFQIGSSLIEVGAVLILFDQRLCVGLIVMFIVFQSLVAALSGIFFWQYMVVNSLLLWAVWSLPPDVAALLFGFQQGAVAAVIILLAYRGRRMGAGSSRLVGHPLRLPRALRGEGAK